MSLGTLHVKGGRCYSGRLDWIQMSRVSEALLRSDV